MIALHPIKIYTDRNGRHDEMRMRLSFLETRLSFLLLTAVVTVIFFGLNIYFDTSSNSYLRLLTTYKIIFGVAFLLFVKVLARKDRDALRIDGIYALALFILVSLISARISNQPYSYKTFIQNCSFILIYSVIVVGCRSLEDIKLLLNILLYCGVSLILFFGTFNVIPVDRLLPNTLMADAVLEGVEHVATYKLEYTQRASMLWFESNSYGYLLSVLILLALRRILCEKCRVSGKIFNYSILLILSYNLVLTQSRGALLATTIAAGFILTKSLRGKQLPILALVGAMVLLVLAANSDAIADLKNRFRTIPEMATYGRDITLYNGTDSGRIITSELALEEFMENPIWGNGGLPAGLYAKSSVHCFYIALLAKWGILGFTFYTAFLIGTYARLRKVILLLKSTDDPNINFAYIFMAMLIVFLIEAFFAPLRYIFWILTGITTGFCRLIIQDKCPTTARKATNRPNRGEASESAHRFRNSIWFPRRIGTDTAFLGRKRINISLKKV